MRSEWNFDTIKSGSMLGSYTSIAKELARTPTAELDEDQAFGVGTLDSDGATKGSNPIKGSIGSNMDAAHSTVIIKPADTNAGDRDVSALLADATVDPPGVESSPPPAYTGSVRNSRRSSYAARNAVGGSGTLLREADFGNGADTIRPVKKVDAAGSLRLSSEFVGSMRRENSTPTSPTSPKSHKRTRSDAGKAGTNIVDNIVVPILANVRS